MGADTVVVVTILTLVVALATAIVVVELRLRRHKKPARILTATEREVFLAAALMNHRSSSSDSEKKTEDLPALADALVATRPWVTWTDPMMVDAWQEALRRARAVLRRLDDADPAAYAEPQAPNRPGRPRP